MILLLMLASVAAPGSGELFTSMAHLQTALYTERDIAKEIRHYIYEEQERLQKLDQLADEFERHSAKALNESELYIGNPVNAYLIVKHFTLDWDKNIDVVIKNNSREELHTKIETMRERLPKHEDLTGSAASLLRLQDTYKLETTELARGNVSGFSSSELSELHTKIETMRERLPKHEDLTGSAASLLRLQDTYKLETTELARGNVSGFSSSELSELHTKIETMRERLPKHEDLTGSAASLLRLQDTYKLETTELARGNVSGFSSSELSARDCFELGRLAFNTDDHYHTIMWMEEALAHVQKLEDDDVNAVDILEYLSFSQFKQGNVRRALSLTNEILTQTPEHRSRANKEYYENALREKDGNNSTRGDDGEVVNKRQLNEYKSGEEFTTYEALCRNESITTNAKYQHRLLCRYRTNNHPLLIISPAKEEVLYLNPFVSVFHDSISDREIKLLQNVSIPKLNRSQTVSDGKIRTTDIRVCKSCWLYDEDSPDIGKINKRIAATTGLSMDTAEPLQIANYGIGGQNEPHSDYYKMEGNKASEDIKHGNRIATFMFYLTDVQAGGATVFPYLGLKVFPEKGKSIFWYNLHKNGRGFFNTRHAACPVLVGSKWVANKWILERGQEFIRPCGLHVSE